MLQQTAKSECFVITVHVISYSKLFKLSWNGHSSDCCNLFSLFLEVSERGEELSANVCRLDGETGSWEVETELPAQRSHHCLAVLGDFIFAAGGSSSRDNGGDAACNLLYRYDPRHNQWTKVTVPNSQFHSSYQILFSLQMECVYNIHITCRFRCSSQLENKQKCQYIQRRR